MWEAKTNHERMLVMRNELISKIQASQTFSGFDLEIDQLTLVFTKVWFGRVISWSHMFAANELETVRDAYSLAESVFSDWKQQMTSFFSQTAVDEG